MNWFSLFLPEYLFTFILLFIRFSTLFVFLPFFNHGSISISIKAALAFYLTLLFFPIAPAYGGATDAAALAGAIFSEAVLGLLAGVLLNIVFGFLMYGGELIAFVMGFSLANIVDPQSQVQSPLISQFLSIVAVVVLLAFNGHHLMLEWIAQSIAHAPPGAVVLQPDILDAVITAMGNLFMLGFMIAFPVISFSLLLDIIFGMLMKTMPQFNLLVVGFPIKIAVGFVVWMTVMGGIFFIFKREFIATVGRISGWF